MIKFPKLLLINISKISTRKSFARGSSAKVFFGLILGVKEVLSEKKIAFVYHQLFHIIHKNLRTINNTFNKIVVCKNQ